MDSKKEETLQIINARRKWSVNYHGEGWLKLGTRTYAVRRSDSSNACQVELRILCDYCGSSEVESYSDSVRVQIESRTIRRRCDVCKCEMGN